ncbi:MAG: NAD(P)-dependent oxidoreductase [Bacteroidales bacterium]|nr:NAD(P)-dependent oxidoreductase [Bacteroidales bacterium]
MSKVIVIGASGFLGSQVLDHLISEGYQVFATQNKKAIPRAGEISIIPGGIKGLSTAKLKEINPVAIFHCARPTFPNFKKWGRILAAEKARRLNKHLVKQLDKSGLTTTLVFASGSLSYGNSDVAHSERSPLNPLSYAKQYIRGESPFLKDNSDTKFKMIVLRFPWLLGKGSWFSWFYLKNIKDQKKIPLFGRGDNLMSVIGVQDAARLMVLYSKQELNSGVYNIYAPFLPTQKEFARLVSARFNCEITDYKNIYPNGLERAAVEAFYSNIVLDSDFQEVLQKYPFKPIEKVLEDM